MGFLSQIRAISGLITPEFRLDDRFFRSPGGFQALKGYDLHSVEKGQPLHVVAGRNHRHREIGAGLTNGTDHLAAHLLYPCEDMLHSGASFRDPMIPSLLAFREGLVLLTLPLNLAPVPFAF